LRPSTAADAAVAPSVSLGAVEEPPVEVLGAIFLLWTGKDHAMFARFPQFVADFLRREDGPTAVEYAVMLALIIVVCISAITTLGGNANSTFTSVGTAIGGTSS
jgi:pilus assembly protein Flp/PilA